MSPARQKRTHSFSGCKTCRRRHLKCDQSVPACNRCCVAGLACEGFAPSLRWLPYTEPLPQDERPPRVDEKETGQFSRRYLFTDQRLRSMSNDLVNDVPSTVAAALNEIEEKSKSLHVEGPTAGQVSVGPFHVCKFESKLDKTMEREATASDSAELSGVEPITPDERHEWHPQGFEPGRDLGKTISFDDVSSDFLDFLQWRDLFSYNFGIPDLPPLFESNDLPPNQPDTFPVEAVLPTNLTHASEEILDQTLDICKRDSEWPRLDLTADAPVLLRHFSDEVMNQMGSLPINEKSAWRTLHWPSAVMTLSYLNTLGVEKESIKNASLANFYALTAVSALHLSSNTRFTVLDMARPENHYQDLSIRLYGAAKHHLRLSLEKECQPPLKAKYKEQLMGISSILAFALLSGNESDTRWCLTEMEYLISLRGLRKPSISRRARLLHNIYAWMRIVSESTHVFDGENHAVEASCVRQTPSHPTSAVLDRSKNRSQAGNMSNQPAKPHVTLDSFLHLQPKPLHQTRVNENPGRDIRDIHLADTQPDHNNMYMQIYGVPETWLSLVSQITRLANVVDRLSTDKKDDAEALLSLQPRSTYLENAVCLFRSRHQIDAENLASAPGVTLHTHMVHALSSALVIFFYRRIRNVNPLVLQDSVNRVIDSLHVFDEALERNGLSGPGTAWPAFIAGAEAMSAGQRESIAAWLDKAFGKSGFAAYRVSKEVLEEVWKKMDEAHGDGGFVTWMEVCRQMRKWPLLS